MSTDKKHIYLLQETILMTAFTLFKLIALYYSAGKPQNMFISALRTSMLLLVIYILINLVIARRYFFIRIAFHEILALIVLADLLYFNYFNVLPGVSDLRFLRILPEIWDSVGSLFSGKHLLLFADAILLIAHHYYMKKLERISYPKVRPYLTAALIMMLLIFTDFSLSGVKNSGQAYEQFGLLHYHIAQLSGTLLTRSNESIPSINKTQIMKERAKTSKDSRLFGLAKDRNIIIIQVEALQDFVINMNYSGQELTPNLNNLLKKNSIYFNRFYQQLGKGCTSDAEFVTQNSFYPAMDLPAYTKYQNNKFMGFPMIMRENGYNTVAFHAYKPEFWNRQNIYPMLGYDKFISMNDFNIDEEFGLGLSDKYFFKQSASYLATAKKPFYSFLITLSSHHPYELPEKYKKIRLLPEHEDTLLGRYLQVINYTDEALGLFIDELKRYGLYENSIIAIYGDHRAIPSGVAENDKLMSGLLGREYTYDESLNVPFIIHIPGTNVNETNNTVGGQIDFLPTMLNLMGIKEDGMKLFGQDLLNTESGFAAFQSNLAKGSFIDDNKIFVMSTDGIFEHGKAWDLNSWEPVELELCRSGYERALEDIQASEYILTNDLILELITLENTHTILGKASKTTPEL